MKHCFAALLIAAIIPGCTTTDKEPGEDVSLEQRLQHTWAFREAASNGVIIEGKTAYLPEGIMNLAGRVTQNGQSRPILASGTWRVKNGYLYYTITKSNVPSIIPNGFTSGDKIVRVTANELTYISSDNGKVVTEHRIK
jgi:hypothetical protein